MREERFIIQKGNAIFFSMMAFFALLTIGGCFWFKTMDVEQCRKYLLYLNVFSLAIMIPYRIRLINDKEYMNMAYPNTKDSYWFELPFFPCNTAEMLFWLALFLNNRYLIAYCFFLGVIGPLIAFLFPSKGFERGSLFDYKILGFYTTHYLCLMNLPLLIVGKVFIPGYRDVISTLIIYVAFSFLMYLLNLYIDTKNLGMKANYFFVMDPDFNLILRKVYNVIPYRFLFFLPIDLFLAICMTLFVFILHLFV